MVPPILRDSPTLSPSLSRLTGTQTRTRSRTQKHAHAHTHALLSTTGCTHTRAKLAAAATTTTTWFLSHFAFSRKNFGPPYKQTPHPHPPATLPPTTHPPLPCLPLSSFSKNIFRSMELFFQCISYSKIECKSASLRKTSEGKEAAEQWAKSFFCFSSV